MSAGLRETLVWIVAAVVGLVTLVIGAAMYRKAPLRKPERISGPHEIAMDQERDELADAAEDLRHADVEIRDVAEETDPDIRSDALAALLNRR